MPSRDFCHLPIQSPLFAPPDVFEQIKIDVAYHNLPVTVVSVGSGLSYAGLGPTHHALEDIAFLRSIPNMRVLNPSDLR